MEKIKIRIARGKILTLKTIKEIDKIWKKEFDDELDLKKPYKFAKDIFFLIYRDKILSVGRLIPIEISFLDKNYSILGIADIASVEKGKGYGKVLMTTIRKYLKQKRKTGLGFCSKKNTPFYRKCRFEVAESLAKRFLYINSKKKLIKDPDDEDVLYLDEEDKFMKKVLSSRKKVITPVPLW